MNFLFEAVDETGLPVFGKIEAADVAEAEQQLQTRGLRPQSVAPAAVMRDTTPYMPPLGRTTVMPRSGTATATSYDSPTVQDRVNNSPEMQELTGIGTVTNVPRSLPLSVTPQANTVTPQPARVTNTRRINLAGNAARVQANVRPSANVPPYGEAAGPEVQEGSTLGGVKTKELMAFFRQLSSLVHSGITLFGALDNLAARTPNANLAHSARDMAQAARNGQFVSDVMERYPRIFEEHIVGLMRAGERGGFVEIALAEIAETYNATIELARHARIPRMMAVQAFLVLPFVIPLFPILFSSLDIHANMMKYVQVVVFVSLPISLLMLGAMVLGFRTLQLPKYRHLRDKWALRVPGLGKLQREIAVRTFLRMIRRLYAAGVSPMYAWEGAMNTAVNVVLREQLQQAYGLMQSGASLADAFLATGLFANQVEQLVITGQQSGQMVEMLDQATMIYEQRVDDATGRARYLMMRAGVMCMIVFGGLAMIWMMKSYFAGIFHIVDSFESGNWGTGVQI